MTFYADTNFYFVDRYLSRAGWKQTQTSSFTFSLAAKRW